MIVKKCNFVNEIDVMKNEIHIIERSSQPTVADLILLVNLAQILQSTIPKWLQNDCIMAADPLRHKKAQQAQQHLSSFSVYMPIVERRLSY